MDKNILLGVGITNATKDEILKYIITSLEKADDSYYIVTPNPEILVYANKHPQFKAVLNNARLGLPDGIGVTMAGRILGKHFYERITGVDFMELLCKEVSEKPITVGFLGGRGGVAEKTAECLRQKYSGLKAVFVGEEWKKTEVDILFVAYGFPKQEEWMAEHIVKIPVKVIMGVGGSFDYISGSVMRAPLLIRSIGFEWLFRLLMQPWRIKRQFVLLQFCLLVLREKLSNNKSDEKRI